MSRTWASGSTRTWRRTRAAVLARDGYRCQVQIQGVCEGQATQVHHTKGKATGDDPRNLQAACQPCNARVNDPARTSAHQQIVAWIRSQQNPVTWKTIADRFPHHGSIGLVLNRALERGELIRAGRGRYAAGPTGLPPTLADPPPQPRTQW